MVARQTLTLFVRVRVLLPQPMAAAFAAILFRGIAQMVARLVRDQEAGRSNRPTPTIKPPWAFAHGGLISFRRFE